MSIVREISIKPVLNGFVCKIGCQIVVFQDTVTLAREIKAYYDNPEATEATYLRLAVNKMSDGPCMPEVAPATCDAPTPTRLEQANRDNYCGQESPARR